MTEVETVANIWRLGADPAALRSAAGALRALETGAHAAAERVGTATARVFAAGWSGSTAEGYGAHRARLTADVGTVGGHLGTAADALDAAAGALRTAQHALDDSRARLAARVGATFADDLVTLTIGDRSGTAVVIAEIQAASDIRADLDVTLASQLVALEWLRGPLRAIDDAWAGSAEPFVPPAEPADPVFLRVDGALIVNTGPGDDTVAVRTDPVTGARFVVVNGEEHQILGGTELVVRGGAGRDAITVPRGTNLRVTLLGGDGDDVLRVGVVAPHGGTPHDGAPHDGRPRDGTPRDGAPRDAGARLLGGDGDDRLFGGAGEDRISAGAGDDYVDAGAGDDTVTGDGGDDVLYGMAGDDRLAGGSGADYLEGATGSDRLDGGADRDVLSGGDGDDTLTGGAGDDTLYGGRGANAGSGGTGADVAFTAPGDRVDADRAVTVRIEGRPGDTIRVEGSPEFVARVRADLDMLAGSPTGREMLTAIDRAHDGTRAVAADWPVLGGLAYQGNELTIRETTDANGYADHRPLWNGGERYTISYNPAHDGAGEGGRPVTVLFHELAHVYDFAHHTSAPGQYTGPDNPGAPNAEREAVGLPVDHDGDPATPDVPCPAHPEALTENRLRRELGLRERTHY
ncbi:M91 family zinc metallopeptidase [Longispora sp. K20-0274]|uniref:M91 family zinc metallopeptidase n=1 Tax=Longispora sp. K20-0274 TaxID=3088255 RepID=UPI00399C4631